MSAVLQHSPPEEFTSLRCDCGSDKIMAIAALTDEHWCFACWTARFSRPAWTFPDEITRQIVADARREMESGTVPLFRESWT